MDILEGKGAEEIPPAVWECIFMVAYESYDLEKVRMLSTTDFYKHSKLALEIFQRKMRKVL